MKVGISEESKYILGYIPEADRRYFVDEPCPVYIGKKGISVCVNILHREDHCICGGSPEYILDGKYSLYSQLCIRYSPDCQGMRDFLSAVVKTQELYDRIEPFPETGDIEIDILRYSKIVGDGIYRYPEHAARLHLGFNWCKIFGHPGRVILKKQIDLQKLDTASIRDSKLLEGLNVVDRRFIPVPNFRISEPRYILCINGRDAYINYIMADLPSDVDKEDKYMSRIKRLVLKWREVDISTSILPYKSAEWLEKHHITLKEPGVYTVTRYGLSGYGDYIFPRYLGYGFCGPRATGKTSIINKITGSSHPTSIWGKSSGFKLSTIGYGWLTDIPPSEIDRIPEEIDVLYIIWSPEQTPDSDGGKIFMEKLQKRIGFNNRHGRGPFSVKHIINKVDDIEDISYIKKLEGECPDIKYIIHNRDMKFSLHRPEATDIVQKYLQTLDMDDLNMPMKYREDYIKMYIRMYIHYIDFQRIEDLADSNIYLLEKILDIRVLKKSYIAYKIKKDKKIPCYVNPKDYADCFHEPIGVPYYDILRYLTTSPTIKYYIMIMGIKIIRIYGLDVFDKYVSKSEIKPEDPCKEYLNIIQELDNLPYCYHSELKYHALYSKHKISVDMALEL